MSTLAVVSREHLTSVDRSARGDQFQIMIKAIARSSSSGEADEHEFTGVVTPKIPCRLASNDGPAYSERRRRRLCSECSHHSRIRYR